jgi:PPOX class probable F420-dependent enzyme
MPFSDLSESQYLALGTWRKNGKVVDTTVWFAQEGDQLLVFSSADAGKVKRLRNSSRARVAPCTVSGKPSGDWIAARAEIITDEAAIERAYNALRDRYGWKILVTDFFSKLAGKMSKRVFIRITPATTRKNPATAKTKARPKTKTRAGTRGAKAGVNSTSTKAKTRSSKTSTTKTRAKTKAKTGKASTTGAKGKRSTARRGKTPPKS